MSNDYTTKQVADILNVSESSVKRWCDKGLIETQRTGGGHRRISYEALTGFLQSSNQSGLTLEQVSSRLKIYAEEAQVVDDTQVASVASPSQSSDQWLPQLRERLFEALVSGNEQEARKLVTQHFAIRERISMVADELLSPCFQEIGRSWANDKVDVFQERRAVGLTLQVLLEIRRLLPQLDSTTVALGCSLAGDDYLLPTTIVEMVLRQNRIQATNLGSNIPFSNLMRAIQSYRPKLVWLSVSHIEDREEFARGMARFLADLPLDATVLIGGRLAHWVEVPDSTRFRHFASMQKLEDFVQSLQVTSSRLGSS